MGCCRSGCAVAGRSWGFHCSFHAKSDQQVRKSDLSEGERCRHGLINASQVVNKDALRVCMRTINE